MANRIVNTSWRAFGVKVLPLGERGENGVTQIVCDVSAPLEQHPYAAFSLIAGNANGDEYPVANAVLEGDNLVWTVTSADTAYAGSGWVQAVMFGPDGEIAKTAKAATLVNQSIDSDEDAPEPVQEWLVEAQKALASIPQTVNAAVDAAVPAALQEAKESGEFDGPQGAQGEQGQDGISPVVEVEKSGNSTTLTITDANGVKTAEILDGQDGADGVSPVVEMSKSGSVTTLSVRDKNGVKTTEIIDGATGATGKTGPIGPAGADGKDGVSPSVTVSKNGKVTTIQIKDVYGVKTATINDGERGPQGEPGVDTSSNLVNGIRVGSLRSIRSAAEGNGYIPGADSFAIGYNTKASGDCSVAEGSSSVASGDSSHAEGNSMASGSCAHSEGIFSEAKGEYSHAEGIMMTAAGEAQHVQGKYGVTDNEGRYAHIVGNGTSTGDGASNAHTLDWDGNAWFKGKVFVGGNSMDDGATELGAGGGTGGADWNAQEGEAGYILNRPFYEETVVGYALPETAIPFIEDAGAFVLTEPLQYHPEIGGEYTVNWNGVPYSCTASTFDLGGVIATVLGNRAAIGEESTTEEPFFAIILPPDVGASTGYYAQVVPLDGATELNMSISGTAVVVHKIDPKFIPPNEFGNSNLRNGVFGGLRGFRTAEENVDGYFVGSGAMALGVGTKAGGEGSFAIGENCEANGAFSVAVGQNTLANGQNSFAGGEESKALSNHSFAFGRSAETRWPDSFAFGFYSVAGSPGQFVIGSSNIVDDKTKYLFIVGNGETSAGHSNAHTLDWDGNAWFKGKVYVGGTSQDDAYELGGADWNAQEGEAGYIANKPFFSKKNYAIIPEAEITFSDMEGMMVAPIASVDLVAGETYTVKFNGTDYQCQCISMDGQNLAMGNLAGFGGEDTGEPFIIAMQSGENFIMSYEGLGKATFGIYGDYTKTISPEFLSVETFDLISDQYSASDQSILVEGQPLTFTSTTYLFNKIKPYLDYGIVKVRLKIRYSGTSPVDTTPMSGSEDEATILLFANRRSLGLEGDKRLFTGFWYHGVVHVEFDMDSTKVTACLRPFD